MGSLNAKTVIRTNTKAQNIKYLWLINIKNNTEMPIIEGSIEFSKGNMLKLYYLEYFQRSFRMHPQ